MQSVIGGCRLNDIRVVALSDNPYILCAKMAIWQYLHGIYGNNHMRDLLHYLHFIVYKYAK